MNNPLEAVTQAVNSLVTALKLPDESAKANEVLGEMSFPQFSRLLPYRDYNQESGLFMNDTTMGFMLEAIPINGANESIVEALDHMLRTKLPRGIPLCIHLMSSQLVGDRIEYGLREFSWSGEQAERFNAITRAYYMKAAATQFPLPEGMNLPLTLRHYRVFISYCSPSKKKSRADILEMENLVKIIRASLQGASITTQTVDAQAFIDIVGEMINHNPDSLYPKRRQLDPYSDLNYQCVEDSFDLKVRADYLTLGLRENGRNSTARILNFHLARNPEIAFLWNVADNYSNLLNPELSISCPFILTLTLVVEDQVKTHSEANLKYMDLEKKSKTSYAKWFPSVEKEAKEWGELRQRLGSGQSSVVSYFLNITAFCKDNNETALEVEQDILNSFRKNGFELISPRFNHMRNFLTCLPFMAGKGLFKQLKEAGVVQRAESFNVANLMPLVADNPLTPAGLLAPTYRNQLAFIDIFFRGMNNTNYNMAVCGTSGAGKTGLIQPLIRSVLDSGGFAVVFDMGDGYKSLCENMGGVYLDGETLRFNPFANITDIDQSAERVRDQLSVMASPNGIRNVLLPSFANAFTEAGFATITFDYRGFGESEGERGRLVPAMQTEDIISVINWAEKQVCIDNQRIGLWGTSLGGCHVFNAAAQDKRVKSIVSQLAFADGEVLVTGEMNELEKASFLSTLNKMAEKKKNTGKEMFVGVTRVLSDNESKVFFEKVKGQYPEMDIKIPFLTVMETLQYKPAESAAKVQCPVLVVIAGQDSVNPPEQGRALYDAVASGTKELYEEADACHYDIYKGAFFERVAAVQTQWFKKHL